jgi:hypothetical protein
VKAPVKVIAHHQEGDHRHGQGDTAEQESHNAKACLVCHVQSAAYLVVVRLLLPVVPMEQRAGGGPVPRGALDKGVCAAFGTG